MTDETVKPGAEQGGQQEPSILQTAADFNYKIQGLKALIESGREPDNLPIFYKIVKPLWVGAENLLPELNIAAEMLEMNCPDEAVKLRAVSSDLEEAAAVLAAFITKLERERGEELHQTITAAASAGAAVKPDASLSTPQ